MIYEIGPYLVTPLSVLLISTGFIGFIIAVYLLQYRKNPGVTYLALMQFFTALWAFFYALEFSATTIELKLFWSKLSYLGIAFTPVSFLFFTLSFASKESLITRQLKTILIAIPLFFITIVFTNDWHHLHWVSARIHPVHNTTIYTYGISFWMLFIFTYTLLLVSIVNIMQLLLRFPEHFQSQLIILVLACFLPVAGNIMYLFHVNPIEGFDWTPVFFLFSGILLAYINLKYGIFNLVPFARNKLIDIMQDAVLVIDRTGRIADANEAFLKIAKRKKNELLGENLNDQFPKFKSLIEQIRSNTELSQLELSIEIEDKKRYFDIRISPLYDKRMLYTGRLVVLRDVTERMVNEQETKIANQRLLFEIKEKEKLITDLDAFAHTVAHDLKNMLGAIVTCSDMMEMEIDHNNKEGMKELNELIQLSANKTLHVTRELLTLASVRQQDVKLEQVDMEKIVQESINRLKDMIDTRNVVIKLPRKWPTAYGYAPWIEEVWVNYLSNAIKYGGSPPAIELGADQLPLQQQVRFWIKDNGKGLSKEDQKKLFTKFTRLDPSRAEGNGLGLSIVKRIIEKLGGEVGVISNAKDGEGSFFYFVLPSSVNM